MTRYRGTGIETLRVVISDQGEAFKERVYSNLSADERQSIETVLPISWVELEKIGPALTRLLNAVANDMFPNKPNPLQLLGLQLAEKDFFGKGVFAILMKFVSVEFAAKQAARLHRRYYDNGEVSLNIVDKNCFEYICKDFPDFPEALQGTTQGYLLKLIEKVGGKNPQMKITKNEPNLKIWRYTWV